MDTADLIAYYVPQRAMTDPERYARLFGPLPRGSAYLFSSVHGLVALSIWLDFGVLQAPARRSCTSPLVLER